MQEIIRMGFKSLRDAMDMRAAQQEELQNVVKTWQEQIVLLGTRQQALEHNVRVLVCFPISIGMMLCCYCL